ncbi:MAG: glycosyltransferase, partial [Candidatus Dormibacteraceae bacterium]
MSNEIRRLGIISLHASPLARLGEGPNGGLNVYVREICRALSKLGVATDVFTRVPGAEPASVHQLAELSRVIEIPLGSENLDRRQLSTLIPSFTAAVAAWDGSGDYDLLWSHYWLSALTAEPLHRQFGSPWAHTGHTWGVVKNQQLAPGAQLEPE